MRVCPRCGWSGAAGCCPTHDRVLLPPERRQLIDKAPLLGCVLDDRYVLVDCIGGGGGGVVYAALQRPLDRVVAVKILHGHLTATPQARARFLQEAKALSRLKSRHTVSVYDFGVTREKPEPDVAYMVMEFVAGESLSDRIKRVGPLSPDELANVVRDLARSLDEAHRIGIIHRDVKPRNIILGVDATGASIARVIDFGIARMESADPQQAVTSGNVVGTPHYMAPELCQPGRAHEADGRADVYAVGITMFEALAGYRPFRAPEALGILYQHVHNAPPALPGADRNHRLHAVQTVIHTALSKQADARYPTVGALADALFSALGRARPKSRRYAPDTGQIPPQMRQITAMYRMDLMASDARQPSARGAALLAPISRAPGPVTLPPDELELVDALDGSVTAENLGPAGFASQSDTFGEAAGQVAPPRVVDAWQTPLALDARDAAAIDAAVRRRGTPFMLPLLLIALVVLGGGAWWLSQSPDGGDPATPVAVGPRLDGGLAAAAPATEAPRAPTTRAPAPDAAPDAQVADAQVADAQVADAQVASAAPETAPPPPSPRLLARRIERAVAARRCRQAKRLLETLGGLGNAARYVRQVEAAVDGCGAPPPPPTGVPARVQIGNLDITAASPSGAEAAIKRRQRLLSGCARQHRLLVDGRAILNLRLDFGGGRSLGARIRHSSTRNSRFDACALAALRGTAVAGDARIDVPLLIKPQ